MPRNEHFPTILDFEDDPPIVTPRDASSHIMTFRRALARPFVARLDLHDG